MKDCVFRVEFISLTKSNKGNCVSFESFLFYFFEAQLTFTNLQIERVGDAYQPTGIVYSGQFM